MASPDVTIVVVPRERFSYAKASLEDIYAVTAGPFSLVYVDAASPRHLRSYLEAASRQRRFELIRTRHFLSPNAARNLGRRRVRSKYVVFVDNDILVAPRWLDELVRCAEETGAWVVGPLCFEGEFGIIHMAGGDLKIAEQEGQLVLKERHRYSGQRVDHLSAPLHRGLSDVVEFHSMLVRTDVFDKIGPFDEGLLNTREHVDFCMTVKKAGGTVYLEPRAAITYKKPSSLTRFDLPFYLTRWSERWTEASLEHFHGKWNTAIEPEHIHWIRAHRRLFLEPLHDYLRSIFGNRCEHIEKTLLYPVEQALNRFYFRLPSSSALP